MQTEPIVFVVDEDRDTCAAIGRLAGMMNLRCEQFASGLEFLDRFDRGQCGCLVMELKAPGIGGLQLQQQLARDRAAIPVIFLTAHATLPIAIRAMRAGAFHFFEKPFHEQELWDAIQDAVTMDQEYRTASQREEEIRSRLATLTVREEQVMRMVAEGRTNRLIAKELDVSIRTVEVRRSALMRKLGLETPDELLRFAMNACHVPGSGNGNGHGNGNGRGNGYPHHSHPAFGQPPAGAFAPVKAR